jgi:hypothetical protein
MIVGAPPPIHTRLKLWAPPALILLATLLHVAYYFPRVVDDVFISLRYADNLAHGNGAVYNVGERVEGYSSPLWMFLQAIGIRLGAEGVTWTKLLGVASLLGVQGALFALMHRVFGVKNGFAWIPSAACAANSYVVNWALLGLETPLHLALLVACPVAIHRAIHAPSRASSISANLCIVALCTVRPEAPLYLVVNLVAPLLPLRSKIEFKLLVLKLAKTLAPAGAILGLLLAVRFAYYGYLVPNTYFVKGHDRAFQLANLNALWGNGASVVETVVYLGGAVSLGWYGHRRFAYAPSLSVLACVYFTSSVVLDWMPSLRHLLPVTVLGPVGCALLLHDWARADGEKSWRRVGAASVAGILGLFGYQLGQIDNRYSPEEANGRAWVMPKSREKIADTKLAFLRKEPPHVAAMDEYEMGQISQLWAILESSTAPLNASWFIGRDIGAVGYFSGTRIFDTAGLVTSAVSHSEAWTRRRQIPDPLLLEAMAHEPLAGEVYEGWEQALGRHPEWMKNYRIRLGNAQAPNAFIVRAKDAPPGDVVVARYREVAKKFPQRFHLHTLYGESVGAVIERRLRIVERAYGRNPTSP